MDNQEINDLSLLLKEVTKDRDNLKHTNLLLFESNTEPLSREEDYLKKINDLSESNEDKQESIETYQEALVERERQIAVLNNEVRSLSEEGKELREMFYRCQRLHSLLVEYLKEIL